MWRTSGIARASLSPASASLEIEVEAEGDDVAQRLGGAAGQGRRQLRLAGVVGGVEGEGVRDRGGEFLVVDALLAGVDGRPVQGAAQLGDLHEVVEVPGLEGGVLAVVDEGQQPARLPVE